jgi:hypothetical protein
MKKIILSITLVLGLNSYAQDYYHGVGVSYNMFLNKLEYSNAYESYSGTEGFGAVMFYYKSTLAFEMSRSTNFGLSAYPAVGGYFNSQTGGYLAYQLPIMGELYFGDVDDVNFNMGLGFAQTGLLSGGHFGITGPIVSIGGSFEYNRNLVGVRAYFSPGLNKTKGFSEGTEVSRDSRMLFGLGVHYMIGN